jgi:hypothetical protein
MKDQDFKCMNERMKDKKKQERMNERHKEREKEKKNEKFKVAVYSNNFYFYLL